MAVLTKNGIYATQSTAADKATATADQKWDATKANIVKQKLEQIIDEVERLKGADEASTLKSLKDSIAANYSPFPVANLAAVQVPKGSDVFKANASITGAVTLGFDTNAAYEQGWSEGVIRIRNTSGSTQQLTIPAGYYVQAELSTNTWLSPTVSITTGSLIEVSIIRDDFGSDIFISERGTLIS